ncbi:hypothetical protein [Gluconobacter cerinus]|uniref:hypothetical protein n=1 Tax=Gluconobacter cerinus TaxID=38307 RepID=UPI001B8B0575|nr:hypothetical protein [Gluconobacter cerinus]MBS0982131.1 hypothetical protein [Gluconobacter cerinus]
MNNLIPFSVICETLRESYPGTPKNNDACDTVIYLIRNVLSNVACCSVYFALIENTPYGSLTRLSPLDKTPEYHRMALKELQESRWDRLKPELRPQCDGEIACYGFEPGEGQIVFHGGRIEETATHEEPMEFVTDRPFSTTLNPDFALSFGLQNAGLTHAIELYVYVLTFSSRSPRVYAYPETSDKNIEAELLVHSGAKLTLKQREKIGMRKVPNSAFHRGKKREIPVYMVRGTISL